MKAHVVAYAFTGQAAAISILRLRWGWVLLRVELTDILVRRDIMGGPHMEKDHFRGNSKMI